VQPAEAIQLFGITLIGATPENGRKLLLTIAYIAAALAIGWLLRLALKTFVGTRAGTRFHFWGRQAVSLVLALVLIVGVGSIWFDNPARLAAVLGLITAGVAFAMQRVITAVAGYFIILRGRTFNVGDRIVMGGVRGDVVGLSFMQTKIMEMGKSPAEQQDKPSMWVKSRQFTGRIVTVTNDKVFDEPVYNYTDQFPYFWDEIRLPVRYSDDRSKAEEILLAAARDHAVRCGGLGEEELARLEANYGIRTDDIDPRTFWRLTDNWLEITVRFLCPDHGGRSIKDRMSREILSALDEAAIPIASAGFEIVRVPPLRLEAPNATASPASPGLPPGRGRHSSAGRG
jgi:small-conductance mechanosensitive channel